MSTAVGLLIGATHTTRGSGRAFSGRVVLSLPQCWLALVASASPSPPEGPQAVPCFSCSQHILLVGGEEGQLWSWSHV